MLAFIHKINFIGKFVHPSSIDSFIRIIIASFSLKWFYPYLVVSRKIAEKKKSLVYNISAKKTNRTTRLAKNQAFGYCNLTCPINL